MRVNDYSERSFERAANGLYLPAPIGSRRFLQRAKAALGDAWLTTVINALMVLIQLLTGWILWLTYQNTVIPTRQKELLSEQLAQLELEKKQVAAEIRESRRAAREAAAALTSKQREVEELSWERRRLSGAIDDAHRSVAESLAAAKNAAALTRSTNAQLDVAQMSIFEQHARIVVARPRLEYVYADLNGTVRRFNESREDPLAAASRDEYIGALLAAWPAMESVVEGVVRDLRSSKSDLFPLALAEELAVYFEERAQAVSCAPPNRAQLQAAYDEKVDAEAKRLKAQVEVERATYVAEGLEKGIRYVFDPESTRATDALNLKLARLAAQSAARATVKEQADKCFERLEAIADGYFKGKGARSQTFPHDVLR